MWRIEEPNSGEFGYLSNWWKVDRMMPESPSFHETLRGLRKADQQAAKAIVERFAGRLIALAHDRLDQRIRTKVGAEDVVQSAFKSFFIRFRDGQFKLRNWKSLWGLLVIITLRKCRRKQRKFYGARRDVTKEVSIDVSNFRSLDREPKASEADMLADTLDELFQILNDRERQVLQLRLQGFKVREISEKMKRTEYTIEGILKRIRKKLKDRFEAN